MTGKDFKKLHVELIYPPGFHVKRAAIYWASAFLTALFVVGFVLLLWAAAGPK